jgi:hypothetical protein
MTTNQDRILTARVSLNIIIRAGNRCVFRSKWKLTSETRKGGARPATPVSSVVAEAAQPPVVQAVLISCECERTPIGFKLPQLPAGSLLALHPTLQHPGTR